MIVRAPSPTSWISGPSSTWKASTVFHHLRTLSAGSTSTACRRVVEVGEEVEVKVLEVDRDPRAHLAWPQADQGPLAGDRRASQGRGADSR